MYSITKGYVKSQEDAKFLVKQISGRGSIYQVRDKHQSFGKKQNKKQNQLRGCFPSTPLLQVFGSTGKL